MVEVIFLIQAAMGKLVLSKMLLDFFILNFKICFSAQMAGNNRKTARELLLKPGARLARNRENELPRQPLAAVQQRVAVPRAADLQPLAQLPADQLAAMPMAADELEAVPMNADQLAAVQRAADQRAEEQSAVEQRAAGQAERPSRQQEHQRRLNLAASLMDVGLPGRREVQQFEEENLDPERSFFEQAEEILERVYRRVDEREDRHFRARRAPLRRFLENQERQRNFEALSESCRNKRRRLN